MAEQKCRDCGHGNPAAALYCERCGKALHAAERDPLVGQTVAGRYYLVEKIGQGTAGTLYRAEHVTLRRRMAVKLLHKHLATSDDAVERFRREAITVCEIDNDHIPQVHDFGRTDDGRLFFAMEFLEGESLAQLLGREGRLSVERTVDILAQIADGLMEAHTLGYVHRDLRPRSIFLTRRRGRQDFVKILDFGLAKLVQPEVDAQRTAMGMTYGDPRYMSPEQARGEAADRRADIYSLGALGFEMLTGEPPFSGDGAFAILGKVLDAQVPRVRDRRPDCPAWLESVVRVALSKTPTERFQTVSQLLDALERKQVLQTQPPMPGPGKTAVPAKAAASASNLRPISAPPAKADADGPAATQALPTVAVGPAVPVPATPVAPEGATGRPTLAYPAVKFTHTPPDEGAAKPAASPPRPAAQAQAQAQAKTPSSSSDDLRLLGRVAAPVAAKPAAEAAKPAAAKPAPAKASVAAPAKAAAPAPVVKPTTPARTDPTPRTVRAMLEQEALGWLEAAESFQEEATGGGLAGAADPARQPGDSSRTQPEEPAEAPAAPSIAAAAKAVVPTEVAPAPSKPTPTPKAAATPAAAAKAAAAPKAVAAPRPAAAPAAIAREPSAPTPAAKPAAIARESSAPTPAAKPAAARAVPEVHDGDDATAPLPKLDRREPAAPLAQPRLQTESTGRSVQRSTAAEPARLAPLHDSEGPTAVQAKISAPTPAVVAPEPAHGEAESADTPKDSAAAGWFAAQAPASEEAFTDDDSYVIQRRGMPRWIFGAAAGVGLLLVGWLALRSPSKQPAPTPPPPVAEAPPPVAATPPPTPTPPATSAEPAQPLAVPPGTETDKAPVAAKTPETPPPSESAPAKPSAPTVVAMNTPPAREPAAPETKPAIEPVKPASKPAEPAAKAKETAPAKPAEPAKPVAETKKSAATPSVEAKPVPKPAEAKPALKPAEPAPAKPAATAAKPTPKPAEPTAKAKETAPAKPAESKPAESKPAESKVAAAPASPPPAKPGSAIPDILKAPDSPKPTAESNGKSGEAASLVSLGRKKLDDGEPEAAAQSFARAAELDPRSADAVGGLGEAAFEQGDFEEASRQLQKAARLAPRRSLYQELLAQAQFKLGRFKDAAETCRKLLKQDPGSKRAKQTLEQAEKKLEAAP